uniref:Uncharacterized protein n=1 Tax=Parascaris univalens TaxID=6257 RepID=A0A915A9K5_PARUN
MISYSVFLFLSLKRKRRQRIESFETILNDSNCSVPLRRSLRPSCILLRYVVHCRVGLDCKVPIGHIIYSESKKGEGAYFFLHRHKLKFSFFEEFAKLSLFFHTCNLMFIQNENMAIFMDSFLKYGCYMKTLLHVYSLYENALFKLGKYSGVGSFLNRFNAFLRDRCFQVRTTDRYPASLSFPCDVPEAFLIPRF